MEIDLPAGNDTLRFGELEHFVEHARNASAAPDTGVTAIGAEQDPELLIALRIELENLANQSVDLRISQDDVQELIDLLTSIEDSEGDARSALHVVRDFRQRLTHTALRG